MTSLCSDKNARCSDANFYSLAIDVFRDSVTIASACNEVLSKLFPGTIGLIPTGSYSGNINYSNKAKMWLVYREQLDS